MAGKKKEVSLQVGQKQHRFQIIFLETTEQERVLVLISPDINLTLHSLCPGICHKPGTMGRNARNKRFNG